MEQHALNRCAEMYFHALIVYIATDLCLWLEFHILGNLYRADYRAVDHSMGDVDDTLYDRLIA